MRIGRIGMPWQRMDWGMEIKRYGIYWADLNPVIGAEISKIRPVVIVSENLMNAHLQTVVVGPLTTKLHPTWRSRIQIQSGGHGWEIAVDQIRTISKLRITKAIGELEAVDSAELRALIVEMYGTA